MGARIRPQRLRTESGTRAGRAETGAATSAEQPQGSLAASTTGSREGAVQCAGATGPARPRAPTAAPMRRTAGPARRVLRTVLASAAAARPLTAAASCSPEGTAPASSAPRTRAVAPPDRPHPVSSVLAGRHCVRAPSLGNSKTPRNSSIGAGRSWDFLKQR